MMKLVKEKDPVFYMNPGFEDDGFLWAFDVDSLDYDEEEHVKFCYPLMEDIMDEWGEAEFVFLWLCKETDVLFIECEVITKFYLKYGLSTPPLPNIPEAPYFDTLPKPQYTFKFVEKLIDLFGNLETALHEYKYEITIFSKLQDSLIDVANNIGRESISIKAFRKTRVFVLLHNRLSYDFV